MAFIDWLPAGILLLAGLVSILIRNDWISLPWAVASLLFYIQVKWWRKKFNELEDYIEELESIGK